jgi:hypothetical protein
MRWKKRIQPGEKLPLKLTEVQRAFVLDALTCLDAAHEAAIKETSDDVKASSTLSGRSRRRPSPATNAFRVGKEACRRS